MATIPVFITFVAGTVLPAATLNSQIRDAGNFQLAKPYCNVFNNATVSATNSTLTLCPWDSETEDNDNMHSTGTNPSRIIFQTTGMYLLIAQIGWAANSTGARFANLRLNAAGSSVGGTSLLNISAAANTLNGFGLPSFTFAYRAANIGDYVETFIEQTSGGALATSVNAPRFQAVWQIA